MQTVVLHQWEASPCSVKVRKVLRHKNIDFTVVNYNGLMGRKAATLSAAGQLPVIDFDGERVQDSSNIVAFLESRVPTPSIVPVAAEQRALAWLLEDWADESLYWLMMAALSKTEPAALNAHIEGLCAGRPAWERVPVRLAVNRLYKRKLAARGLSKTTGASVLAELSSQLTYLDTLLEKRSWLVSDTKSIADIAVSAQLDGLLKTTAGTARIHQSAHLADWLARCA